MSARGRAAAAHRACPGGDHRVEAGNGLRPGRHPPAAVCQRAAATTAAADLRPDGSLVADHASDRAGQRHHHGPIALQAGRGLRDIAAGLPAKQRAGPGSSRPDRGHGHRIGKGPGGWSPAPACLPVAVPLAPGPQPPRPVGEPLEHLTALSRPVPLRTILGPDAVQPAGNPSLAAFAGFGTLVPPGRDLRPWAALALRRMFSEESPRGGSRTGSEGGQEG